MIDQDFPVIWTVCFFAWVGVQFLVAKALLGIYAFVLQCIFEANLKTAFVIAKTAEERDVGSVGYSFNVLPLFSSVLLIIFDIVATSMYF